MHINDIYVYRGLLQLRALRYNLAEAGSLDGKSARFACCWPDEGHTLQHPAQRPPPAGPAGSDGWCLQFRHWGSPEGIDTPPWTL